MTRCSLDLHDIPLPGGYCSQCAKCQFCHKQISAPEYQWCLLVAAKYEQPIAFQHPGCFSEIERLANSAESVTIPKAYFDKLNAARLLLEPISELNPKTNEIDAQLKVRQFVHEMTLEDQFLFLKRMESVASECSLLLSKSRRDLETKFSERDKEKFVEARRQREAQKDLSPKTHERVAKKKLSKDEKAIEYLMHLGLTESEAIAQRDEMKTKAAARNGETIQ